MYFLLVTICWADQKLNINIEKSQPGLMTLSKIREKVRRYVQLRRIEPATPEPNTIWIEMVIHITKTTFWCLRATGSIFTPLLVLNAHVIRRNCTFYILVMTTNTNADIASNFA